MTKITRALNKLQEHITNHMLENVEFSGNGTFWQCGKAALIDTFTVQHEGRVSTVHQRFVFLVEKESFDRLNLPIQRGLTIRYKNNDYELVLDPKGSYSYNDQESRNYIFRMDKLEAVAQD